MNTMVTIDETLVARAAALTGYSDASAMATLGLETLIQQESSRRLALLGGSDSHAVSAERRRSR